MGKKPDIVAPYRVENGKNFRLRDYDPADSGKLRLDKEAARRRLQEGVMELAELQGRRDRSNGVIGLLTPRQKSSAS